MESRTGSMMDELKMTDILSKKHRSVVMSRVRSADTKPEWILRGGLHRLGFRYRLGNKDLPGRPDLVFPKYRAVVFVHGCYWHRHTGCKDASMPKTNVAFWSRKFTENVERDRRKERELAELGWRVMVVWECELTHHTVETIHEVALWLMGTASDSEFRYDEFMMERGKLLAMAEEKVRYRIASYGEKPDSSDSVAAKRR
jgi:DNA mismatch endonuclease, patch repair protein